MNTKAAIFYLSLTTIVAFVIVALVQHGIRLSKEIDPKAEEADVLVMDFDDLFYTTLASDDEEFRNHAVHALCFLRDDGDKLEAKTKDPNVFVRALALWILRFSRKPNYEELGSIAMEMATDNLTRRVDIETACALFFTSDLRDDPSLRQLFLRLYSLLE